jgi:tetratricopeptide (TPR) repeat protein
MTSRARRLGGSAGAEPSAAEPDLNESRLGHEDKQAVHAGRWIRDLRQRDARRVFISHTGELRVLPPERSFVAAVEAAVTRAGDVVVDMAYFTAADQRPTAVDQHRLAAADVYVLVAGFRYGSPVRERPKVSYTELEFETAGQLGLPRLVFLLSDQVRGPAGLFLDPQFGARQAGFRQRLRDSGVTLTEVLSPDHLEMLVFDALQRLPRADSPFVPVGRVWGMPGRPTRFTGRDTILIELRAALAAHTPTVVQAVHGMGGAGKTTLVLEYTHRYRDDYDIAWWVPAEQPELITERLFTLAQALGLGASNDNADAAVARLLGVLQDQGRWLLVFDNAKDPAALARFLPASNGHVIITSRNPYWQSVGATIEIGEFTRAESTQLVRSRVLGISEGDAAALAEAVGDLPLAVDQAAALLMDTGWPVTTYLRLLRERTEQVLQRRDYTGGYPVSIAAAWQLSFTELAAVDAAAIQALSLAAWWAPEPIPVTAFTEHSDQLPEPLASVAADPLAWASLLGLLRNRALARISPDSVLLHRIPAALLRAGSPVSAPPQGWEATAVRVLAAVVPADPWNAPVTWPVWQRLLPHVLTAVAATSSEATAPDDVDWLLERIGTYLVARGDPRAALAHLDRAYQQRHARLGPDHPDALASANSLAIDLRALGEYVRARELDQETWERRRRVLGEDHADTLVSANNLALDLHALGEYEQARDLDLDTFVRRQRVFGDDHPNTLTTANNLARDFSRLGERVRARHLREDTLERRRRVLGEDHPDTLLSANNVGVDLYQFGEHEQARDLDLDTFVRRQRVLGDDHPSTLISASNLARDLYVLGEYERARELDEATLIRRQRVLGEDHESTLSSANNLVRDLNKIGDHGRARELEQRVRRRRQS